MNIADYDRTDHRDRLSNIAICEQGVVRAARRHLIGTYLPGQASYQLGDYPSSRPYEVTEVDEAELQRLADSGVQLLQVMEDWNDLLRIQGADKFSSPNPTGLARFVEAAHRVDIKVLLYVSSGYMQYGDPDLRDGWTREPPPPPSLHWRLVRCSPTSPGWREYHARRLVQVLDDWGADGIYDDWGHRPARRATPYPPTAEEVVAWPDTVDNDAAKVDQLALQYDEVARRGGILKLHADLNQAPVGDHKTYDYLWVGENVGNLRSMMEETSLHEPYVVPAFDMREGSAVEDHKYLYSIPFMQFPQVFGGKPLTGERAVVPGVEYRDEDADPLLRSLRDYRRRYLAGDLGSSIYSVWELGDDPDPRTRTLWSEWLAIYRDLTEFGTRAYLDVTETSLLHSVPKGCVVSIFANRRLHYVLANFTTRPAEFALTGEAVDVREPGTPPRRRFTVPPEALVVARGT